jgi:hypothetical protein
MGFFSEEVDKDNCGPSSFVQRGQDETGGRAKAEEPRQLLYKQEAWFQV